MAYPKDDIISGVSSEVKMSNKFLYMYNTKCQNSFHCNNHKIIQLSIPPNECKTLTTISSILYTLRSYLFFPSPERLILLYSWVLIPQIITTEHAACYMTMYVVPACSGPALLGPPSTLNQVRRCAPNLPKLSYPKFLSYTLCKPAYSEVRGYQTKHVLRK